MSATRSNRTPASTSTSLTVPELEQSKISVLATLPSAHSRRTYGYAIEKFIDWSCSEPRLGFNRSVMVRYRLERINREAEGLAPRNRVREARSEHQVPRRIHSRIDRTKHNPCAG